VLTQHSGVVIVGAVAVTLASLAVVLWALFGSTREVAAVESARGWFVELETGDLFVDDATREPPFEHNGGTAVRAYVWTCDGCSESERFIAMYEKRENGRILISTDGQQWVVSEPGGPSEQLWDQASRQCDGPMPEPCPPVE
jgi:hypothetical protein